MRTSTATSVLAAAAVVVGLALTGCGSGGDDPPGTSAQASASSAEETTTETTEAGEATETSAAGADSQTVAEYLTAQGVTQTIVTRDDPAAPRLNLPMPPGWADVGGDTPQDAYGAIYLESAKDTPNPPAILARMARLEGGDFDPATILELSPNAVTRTPGWEGPAAGQPSTLGGFQASAIAGTAVLDGVPNFIARKTVVIPGPEVTYLLALDAQGPVEQQQALIDAMTVIDNETTIEP